MGIDSLFSRAVFINLDRREDRAERMRRRFEAMGMRTVGRVPAVDGSLVDIPPAWRGNEGNYGCLLSHQAAVAEAESEGCECLLVFEDDVEFSPDLEPRLVQILDDLPDDWTFLYLGASHRRPPIPIGRSFAQATYALATFAYVIRRPAFEWILALDRATTEPIDVRLARLQQHRTFHCAMPNLAWLECDYSDIQRSITNHWYIKESLVIGDICDEEMAGRVALILPLDWPGWRDSDPSAAPYLIDHFQDAIPGLSVLEVRGDPDPNPAACALEAARTLGDRVDFLLVAGSPVFFSKGHLLGALQMCRKFPVVSPFNEVVPLPVRDVALVLAGHRRSLDLSARPRERSGGFALDWAFYRRDALLGPASGAGRSISDSFEVPSFGLNLGNRERRPMGVSP